MLIEPMVCLREGFLSTLRPKKYSYYFFTSAVPGQSCHDPSPYLAWSRSAKTTKSCGQIGRCVGSTRRKQAYPPCTLFYRYWFRNWTRNFPTMLCIKRISKSIFALQSSSPMLQKRQLNQNTLPKNYTKFLSYNFAFCSVHLLCQSKIFK